MKYFLLLAVTIFAGCANSNESDNSGGSNTGTYPVPKPNTVVASDSMRIPDALNELYYSIEVIATDRSNKGLYEVLVTYGHNDASGQLSMPEADKPIIPEVRRGSEPFTYIIGFHHGADTSFNDYFLVQAGRGQTSMKYIKAYSFK